MLEALSLENIGVIRAAEVQFDPGLTVITGETGAGKTMLLTGLNLLMGAKADRDVIRAGTEQASVEGTWLLSQADRCARQAAALDLVAEAGGHWDDDGQVIAARVLTEARSKAHLGGRTVPQAVLAEFSSELVTVHGQSDQVRLRTQRKQLAALDAYAGSAHLAVVLQHAQQWRAREAAAAELAAITRDRTLRQAEAEQLRAALDQISALSPQPGELAALDQQINRLENVEGLRASAAAALAGLDGDFADGGQSGADPLGAGQLLLAAQRQLGQAGDAALTELAERLRDLHLQTVDVASELAGFLDDLAADPAALNAAQQRKAALQTLTRAYGDPLVWSAQAEQRLLELSDDDSRIAELGARVGELDAELEVSAEKVSATRQASAAALGRAVTTELRALAMADALFEVAVAPAQPGPSGQDAVTFRLTPHPGAGAQPIAKGASGGELSRVMLAVEVALAQAGAGDGAANDLPTFIFDEVDAGVGGAAAVEVGRRLARLADLTQVVVVTHLAQVAAFADRHLVVQKTSAHQQTETAVVALNDAERVRELARMLSGNPNSNAALGHATELLTESRTSDSGPTQSGGARGGLR